MKQEALRIRAAEELNKGEQLSAAMPAICHYLRANYFVLCAIHESLDKSR